MKQTIGYNKEQIKDKFDSFYQDGKSHWSFDIADKMYLAKKSLIEPVIEKSKNILDLGCAEGNFLASIVNDKSAKYIVGVDIAQTAILLAKEKNFYDELYVGFIDDTNSYTNKTNKFDLVLLNEVLYYVNNYIESLKKVLEVSGKYVFISLAMGPQFFNDKDAKKIENTFNDNGYRVSKLVIYDMGYKFGIPMRYLTKVYERLRGIKLKQTHKYIYIYEKIDN